MINSLWFCVVYYVDPFADAIKGSEEGVQDGFVHIRIQQRNGRKTLTTVQGLSTEYDLKKIVRACKKVKCKINNKGMNLFPIDDHIADLSCKCLYVMYVVCVLFFLNCFQFFNYFESSSFFLVLRVVVIFLIIFRMFQRFIIWKWTAEWGPVSILS